MADQLQLVHQLELEAWVVRLVVARATDLKQHAGLALLGEPQDLVARAVLRVPSAGAMAALTADSRERSAGGPAGRLSEAGRVTALTLGISGVPVGLERLQRPRVRRFGPECVLLGVTRLASRGAHVVGALEQVSLAQVPLLEQLLALLQR